MLKKTVAYKDFNGIDHTEDLYFHVSRASVLTASDDVYNEIISIGKQLEERARLLEAVEATINENDPFDENNQILAESVRMLARLLDRLIDLSYGKRSEDGVRFIKNQEVLDEFKQSIAYSTFVEHMLAHQDEMLDFINRLLKQ